MNYNVFAHGKSSSIGAPALRRAVARRADPTSSKYRGKSALGTLAIFALWLSLAPASASDYQLAPGDVLELNVISAPELHQRIEVGIDGVISFPLLGDIQAAGRTLKDIRSDVQTGLTKQPYRRQVATEAASSVYNIAPGEISLVIAEFRPVYVSGDVAHPGQVTYRPGMTVRQAVAITGGYGRDRVETGRGELETKYDQAALDYAKFSLQVQRIEMELGRRPKSDKPGAFEDVPVTTVSRLANDQEDRRVAGDQAFAARQSYLNDALAQSANRIAALDLQAKNEQAGADLDAAEVTNVDELFHKGLVSASRLTEARRSGLLSASRALETKIALEDARRDRVELQSKLDALTRDRSVDLLKDLETAEPSMRAAAVEMQGIRRQLGALGGMRGEAEVVIFRGRGADASGGVPADEDAELLPGDTVEITILRKPQGEIEAGTIPAVK